MPRGQTRHKHRTERHTRNTTVGARGRSRGYTDTQLVHTVVVPDDPAAVAPDPAVTEQTHYTTRPKKRKNSTASSGRRHGDTAHSTDPAGRGDGKRTLPNESRWVLAIERANPFSYSRRLHLDPARLHRRRAGKRQASPLCPAPRGES